MTLAALRRHIDELARREADLSAARYASSPWHRDIAAQLRRMRERAELELENAGKPAPEGPTLWEVQP